MSTKIYDAIRIKKSYDLKIIINEMKEIANNYISNNYDILHDIHEQAIAYCYENKNDHSCSSALEDHKEGKFNHSTLYAMRASCKKEELSPYKDYLDFILKGVVSFDKRYWYIKFFCNSNVTMNIFDRILEIQGIEDYHYQNQTDPPDGISYKNFQKRNKKFEELMPNDRYDDMPFEITIFDFNSLEKLITKFWHTGKPLYEHLAYKFD